MSLSKEERQLLSRIPSERHIREKIYRNIPTAHPTKDLFFPGQVTKREASILDAFANLGSSIDHSESQRNRPFQYGDNEATSFCFDAVIVPNTRFSDGRPVWYGSDNLDTSKAEIIFHLRRQANRELESKPDGSSVNFERVVFEASVSFDGVDLSGQTRALPGLMEDGPPYPFCAAVGGVLRALGCEGVIFASVRRPSGINYGLFAKETILSSKATCYFPVRIFKSGKIEVCGESYTDLELS